jgi:hypothetical protein
MIKNIVFTVAFICFGMGQSAYGQTDTEKYRCDKSIVNLVGKHSDISDFSYSKDHMYASVENGGVIIAGVCKVWPKDISKTIGIFAYDDGVEYEKRLIVVLLNNKTKKVIATYMGSITEDSAMTVGGNSLRIDTAPYDLAPGVRAFGLDVTTSYSQGCGDGGLGPTRTLFIQDGKEIRPILENFYVSSFRYIKGASCVTEGEIVIEDIYYSIGISKATTNGFANLVITATSSLKRKPFQYELHYDGKRYSTSPALNGGGAELDKWKNAP